MKMQKPVLTAVHFPDSDVIAASGAGFTRLPVGGSEYYANLPIRYVTYKTEVDESNGSQTVSSRLWGIAEIAADGSATAGGRPDNSWYYTWFNASDSGWYTEDKTLQSYIDAGYEYATIRKDNSTN